MDNGNPKIISFPQQAITPDPTDYFSFIEPIPLETGRECQIGTIDKLVVKGGVIFILDYTQKTLFLFDINGKFISKINAVGRGPGEYHKIGDFYIDSKNRMIEILDGWKIMKYDFSGKYIDGIRFERPVSNFYKTKNGNYWLWTGSQYVGDNTNTLVFANSQGKIIESYYPWDKKGRLFSNQVMFTEYENNILFRPFSQDYTIRYLGENGEIIRFYQIDFGKFAMPAPFKEGDQSLNGQLSGEELGIHEYARNINDIFETENYVIFNLLIGDNMRNNFIYSKKLSKSVFSEKCSHDAVLPHMLWSIIAVDEEYMYGSIPSYTWFKFVQPRLEKSPIDNEKLMNLSKQIKADDNDIIFKLKINDAIFEK